MDITDFNEIIIERYSVRQTLYFELSDNVKIQVLIKELDDEEKKLVINLIMFGVCRYSETHSSKNINFDAIKYNFLLRLMKINKEIEQSIDLLTISC